MGIGTAIITEHAYQVIPIDVGTTVGATQALDFRGFQNGGIWIPTGSTITALTFHVAPIDSDADGGRKLFGADADEVAEADNYLPAYDELLTAVAYTGLSGGNAYVIPECLCMFGFIKMVGDAADTVYVSLKG